MATNDTRKWTEPARVAANRIEPFFRDDKEKQRKACAGQCHDAGREKHVPETGQGRHDGTEEKEEKTDDGRRASRIAPFQCQRQ